jgi:CRP/FNR family cyclic AMP-dependent transcriptional regulator
MDPSIAAGAPRVCGACGRGRRSSVGWASAQPAVIAVLQARERWSATDLSSFFAYPEGATTERGEGLVFLAERGDGDWGTLLSHCETHRFRAGEVVIRQGEVDRALYIVLGGQLEVLVPLRGGRLHRLATIEPGSVIGEQAFLDGLPRSATVRATSEGEMLRLSLEAFEVLAAREPELARAILFDHGRLVSIKLRHDDAVIAQLMR